MVRVALASVLLIGSSLLLAGCLQGSAVPPETPSPTPSSTTTGTQAPGLDDATLKARLAAIPGVRSVELKTEKGLDVGRYQDAALQVSSRDTAAAVAVVDRAMAVLWAGPMDTRKRVYAWVPDAQGRLVVADDRAVDAGFEGATYEKTMTRRYGPWPGRGVPPTP